VERPWRIACLVSHPIQYQAPLFRRIAMDARLDLTVFFSSSMGARAYRDPGFGIEVTWDVPLLEGYRHEFLGSQEAGLRAMFHRLKDGNFDALWLHDYAQGTKLRALLAARALGVPVILRCESHLQSHPRSIARRAAKAILLRLLFRGVDAFLAIGAANRGYYLHYGVSPERIFMVPYAVDNHFFRCGAERAASARAELRAELALEPGRPVILYAAKLIAAKRPHDLLDAYLKLSADGCEPRPYLLLVGDGAQRRSLELRARATGWRSIRFCGFIGQQELPRYYDLCDVFVLPSEFEPWGLVVNEAMNAGKPVVVTDRVGAAADLVRDGVNGFVVPARNVARLSASLGRLADDPLLRVRMGAASRSIIEHWDFEADLAGLLQALDARAPRRSRGVPRTIPDKLVHARVK